MPIVFLDLHSIRRVDREVDEDGGREVWERGKFPLSFRFVVTHELHFSIRQMARLAASLRFFYIINCNKKPSRWTSHFYETTRRLPISIFLVFLRPRNCNHCHHERRVLPPPLRVLSHSQSLPPRRIVRKLSIHEHDLIWRFRDEIHSYRHHSFLPQKAHFSL